MQIFQFVEGKWSGSRGSAERKISEESLMAHRRGGFNSVLSWVTQLSVLVLLTSCVTAPCFAQSAMDYSQQTGTPAFSTIDSFPGGFVNLANGNVRYEISFGDYPQRGGSSFTARLAYDSRFWRVTNTGTAQVWTPVFNGSGSGGWTFFASDQLASLSSGGAIIPCNNGLNATTVAGPFVLVTADNTPHVFPVKVQSGTCTTQILQGDAFALDGSGYHLFATSSTDGSGNVTQISKVYDRHGTLVFSSDPSFYTSGTFGKQGNLKDSNGNIILANPPNYFFSPGDTLGRQVYTLSGSPGISSGSALQVLNSQNLNSQYRETWATIAGITNFMVSGVSESQWSFNVLQSLTLPDDSSYQFVYDCDLGSGNVACGSPSGQSGYSGELIGVTLPTGGTIAFTYTHFTDANGNTNIWVETRSSGGGTWRYSPATGCGTGCQTVTQTRPSGDQSLYTFTLNQGNGAWATSVQHFAGGVSGTPLMSIVNQFQSYAADSSVGSFGYTHPTTTTTTLQGPSGNLVKQTTFGFDSVSYTYNGASYTGSAGKLLSKQDYGFGKGAAGPLLRTTSYSYWDDAVTSYKTVNIVDRVSDITISDAGGNKQAETKISYDSTTLTSVTGIVNHDDTNFGSSYTLRGNPTQIQRWVSGTTYLSGSLYYDTTGQIVQSTDPAGNSIGYSYNDNFYTDAGDGPSNPPQTYTPSKPTNAYLTKVSPPLIPPSTFGYYFGTGQPAIVTDPNGATSYSHFYDLLNRPTSLVLPDGAWGFRQYASGGNVMDVYKGITGTFSRTGCSGCRHDQAILDGLGRAIAQTLVSDPEGATTVTNMYDSSGRLQSTSHPQRMTPSATDGVESVLYDALGRGVRTTHADGSFSQVFYGAAVPGAGGLATPNCTTCGVGYAVLTVDEAGRLHQTWTDAFGRVFEVDDPAASGSGTSTASVGSVTVGGAEQSVGSTYDSGIVWVTVGGFEASAGYGQNSSSGSLASALAAVLNSNTASPVSAAVSGSTINLASKLTGANTNYSVSAGAITGQPGTFSSPSFNASAIAGVLTGGSGSDSGATAASGSATINGTEQILAATLSQGTVTISEPAQNPVGSGTATIVVNGFTATFSDYGAATPAIIASGLASALNVSGSPVTAYAIGATIIITSKASGPASNYPFSVSWTWNGSSTYSPFAATQSAPTLTGGGKETDTGTVSITVNGFSATACYSATSTPAGVASSVANAFNSNSASPVTASVAGATINFAAKSNGAASDFAITSNTTTFRSDLFSQPSFNVSVSGPVLNGGANGGNSGFGTTSYTTYSYDVLDDLLQVTQGSQTRTVAYDGLGRIISTCTTEMGPSGSTCGTTYTYYTTSAGSVCAGDSSAVCRITDPKGTTTSYSFDALSRLTGQSYSDSTPATTYCYDGNNTACGTGLASAHPIGRETAMKDGSGSTAWSYDIVGNPITKQRTITTVTPSLTQMFSYTYNLDGSVATMSYPSGRTINYSYSNAERPLSAIDTANQINYATNATYWPTGAIASLVHGNPSGSFQGITESYNFNNRGQVTSIQASSSAGTALSLAYGYGQAAGNNGNIASITNNSDNTRSQTFTYDNLNRLASAQSQATSGSNCWGLNMGLDTIGNLTTETPTQCSAFPLSISVNAKNQITNTGFAYDLDGRMTSDGSTSYSFDAEDRLTSAGGVNYSYDGNGLRVAKSNGTIYWRGIEGGTLSETNSTGGLVSEYVFFGGARIARRDSSNNVSFIFTDHLGSTRVVTNATGTPCYEADYTPYGGEITPAGFSNTCSINYKFTGYERDSETGLDYAKARYYNNHLGRFMSVDPVGGNPGSSQSWNAYAYVQNNPLNATDPSGMDCTPEDGWTGCDASDCPLGICLSSNSGIGSSSGSFTWNGITFNWSSSGDLSGSQYWAMINNTIYLYMNPGIGGGGGPKIYQASQWSAPIPSQAAGPSGCTENSIYCQMMDPNQCSDCRAKLDNASNWITAGTIWEGALTGIAFAAPAVVSAAAAVPSAVAWTTGTARALLGATGDFVIGSYAGYWNYLRIAAAYGYGAYNLWMPIYNAFQRLGVAAIANEAYISTQIFLGRNAVMWEEESENIPATRALWSELQQLIQQGVKLKRIPTPTITWPNVSR